MSMHLVSRSLLPPRFKCRPVLKQAATTRALYASHSGDNSLAPRRGAFIVFEGIDRCGKSTQSSLLVEALKARGVPVQQWCFPDRTTTTGKFIDDYLKDRINSDDAEVHLMFAANRFGKRRELLSLLAGGTTIVCDRYSYSGVAYSAAKGLPHLSADYCRGVETGLPAADLVVHMDIDPELAAARCGFGSERYEKLDFQRRVAQQYAPMKDERWLTLDATAPQEQLHSQVLSAALPLVERVSAGGVPLGRLWDYQPIELPAAAAAAATPGV